MLQKFLLAGAFFSGSVLLPVWAQTPAAPTTQTGNGYDLLVEAGTKLLPGPNGGAANTDPNISPEENLKRERLAVARNAPALALVRRALERPIEVPQKAPEKSFPDFSRFRELARQMSQESDVRLADGDFVGAMNSKLDTMRLGAALQQGSLISALVGIAIEAIGYKDADKIATRLDAKQCRDVSARLQRIETRRATLAQVLRDEQRYSLLLATGYLADAKTQKDLKPDEDGNLPFATARDIAQIKALTPQQLALDNARLFDALVSSAALPYSNAAPIVPPENELNPFTRGTFLWSAGGRYRFNFERPVLQNRLLRAALELRAQKLESGVYPALFVAPLDPFSPESKPLVYKKVGDGFLLYSVGPDGKDDGGAKIRTQIKDEETGKTLVTDKLWPESTGDIVQPPF